MRRLIVTGLFALALAGCTDKPKAAPAKASAPTAAAKPNTASKAAPAEAALPVVADFEAEADTQINDKNYKTELESLEKAITNDSD